MLNRKNYLGTVRRCGKCAPCLKPNCTLCLECKDMLKYGGNAKRNHSCLGIFSIQNQKKVVWALRSKIFFRNIALLVQLDLAFLTFTYSEYRPLFSNGFFFVIHTSIIYNFRVDSTMTQKVIIKMN